MVPLPVQIDEFRDRLRRIGQEHLLTFWAGLTPNQQQELWADLAMLPLDAIAGLAELAARPKGGEVIGKLSPPMVLRRSVLTPEVVAHGESLLAGGKVAAFTVAGGQGTRLGFDGPKGAFCITPVRNKPLFQVFAEQILSAERRYGCRVRWYVMTSPVNDEATREYFREHDFFGLREDGVLFFQQGVMPAFDRRGRILLDEKHRVALSPDGHGGSLLALARSGMIRDMAAHGIEHISYFQVDNPLVHCLDPGFLGLHDRAGSEMSSKTLPKADDLERVGNFALMDGKLTVVEYSDFPEDLASARNPDGSRTFDAANIAVHALSRRFVERLTADSASFALPWHRAEKKVPFVDLQSGRRIEPAESNGVKLEAFVFDALPLADRAILLETSRAEEFSPVKNATGVDSADTARADMSARAARWLATAGWSIPNAADGRADGVFEISPHLACCAADVSRLRSLARSVSAGERVYVE